MYAMRDGPIYILSVSSVWAHSVAYILNYAWIVWARGSIYSISYLRWAHRVPHILNYNCNVWAHGQYFIYILTTSELAHYLVDIYWFNTSAWAHIKCIYIATLLVSRLMELYIYITPLLVDRPIHYNMYITMLTLIGPI